MTEAERCADWARMVEASPASYRVNALLSVLENDGEAMLVRVLKMLKAESSLELVKRCQ